MGLQFHHRCDGDLVLRISDAAGFRIHTRNRRRIVPAGTAAYRDGGRERAERRRLMGPQVRGTERAAAGLRHDELAGHRAHHCPRPRAGGGRERPRGRGCHRAQREAPPFLFRKGRGSLRRPRRVDADPRGQRQMRHGRRAFLRTRRRAARGVFLPDERRLPRQRARHRPHG